MEKKEFNEEGEISRLVQEHGILGIETTIWLESRRTHGFPRKTSETIPIRFPGPTSLRSGDYITVFGHTDEKPKSDPVRYAEQISRFKNERACRKHLQTVNDDHALETYRPRYY